MEYNPQAIEKKWQKRWEKAQLFKTPDKLKKKLYILDMFPYPSGEGLHVGHLVGYIATDILTRFLRTQGYDILHPMGWDAFGLPAENYAIKSGVHPVKTTAQNIKRFRQQIKSVGLSYDWTKEIDTSSPDYYKWTQWLFLQFYKNGLAERKEAPVNFCPDCQTVLANEQVIDGRCERCGNLVFQKKLEQWFFKTTDFAEELLTGLEKLDWPEGIKLLQKNWIGRSEGTLIKFKVVNSPDAPTLRRGYGMPTSDASVGASAQIETFTTRPDTLFGATYLVLAPEHPLALKVATPTRKKEVEDYIKKAALKTELERTALQKEKTGVFTGSYAINPANEQKIPIWLSDYVVLSYGTGAIMAVPAHDERDFQFAKKFKLPIIEVISPIGKPTKLQKAYIEPGILINSGKFSGMSSEKAKEVITKELQKIGKGSHKIQYKLRDWLISRQRYWGAPIPIIYCQKCGEVPVPEKDLPVKLPEDVDFRPKGESPLARSKSFHKIICPKCHSPAKRESDTMDTFVDSSWYFLRFSDPHNQKEAFGKVATKRWLPVNIYVGGAEHAVLHLLYARFVTKALHRLSYLDFEEPFLKLENQGLILGEDGQKMSKSRGNVINPDEIIKNYGADALRLYEMFMGPLEVAKPWNTKGFIGTERFLKKVFFLTIKVKQEIKDKPETLRLVSSSIKKVTDDIKSFNFNTAISQLMILANHFQKEKNISRGAWLIFLKLLAPFAPHLAEELWQKSQQKGLVEKASWPSLFKVKEKEFITIPVQVNGKLRGTLALPKNTAKENQIKKALNLPRVKVALQGKKPLNVIFVPEKIINFVTPRQVRGKRARQEK